MAPLAAASVAALLLLSAAAARPPRPPPVGSPNSTCTTTCGDMQVPYPFGLGPPHCYWPGFNLTCDHTSRPGHPRLLLPGAGAGAAALRVVNISLADSTVTDVRAGVNITSRSRGGGGGGGALPLPAAHYTLSKGNELVLVGCNVQATLIGAGSNNSEEVIGGCAASCSDFEAKYGSSEPEFRDGAGKLCSGIWCCQAAISGDSVPKRVVYRRFNLDLDGGGEEEKENPFIAFVAKEGWFDRSPAAADEIMASVSGPPIPTPSDWHRPSAAGLEIPVVLGWTVPLNDTPVIDAVAFMPWCSDEARLRLCKSRWSICLDQDAGSLCSCVPGYEGNPYITDGCQDINECDHPEVYKCFGKCTNLNGKFDCRCPHGTHGNYTIPNGCRPVTGQ
ncbi:unnamed protein product [Urochloa humidicola]